MDRKQGSRIVFVGGGHAHLYSLLHADRLIREGAEVVLVGPDQYHYYSGMGPGMLSRIYGPDDVRIDVQRLIESRGGRFVRGEVTGIDPGARSLSIDTGESLEYDIVSFNLGSYVPADLITGAENEAYPVKPIKNLEALRQAILAYIHASTPRILVIGAGPAGVEITGNILRLVNNSAARADVTLAGAEERLLPRFPLKAGLLAQESLSGRGVTIMPSCQVSSLEKGTARTADGNEIPYDLAVLTTGIRPKQVYEGSGIETAPNGSLLVNEFLQSTSHPAVFGGGDCITFRKQHLDMVGVYAVKQAPVLFDNIRARLLGEPLKEFVPQKTYLLIFNLGDGTAIFVRSPIVFRAKWAFTLKDTIDRRFISRFQR